MLHESFWCHYSYQEFARAITVFRVCFTHLCLQMPTAHRVLSKLPHIHSLTAKALLQAGFQQEVYYMLVDVWRLGSDRLPDAIRSYKAHVATCKAKPDWKGFIVGIFGLDVIKPLLVQRLVSPILESDVSGAAADNDEGSA